MRTHQQFADYLVDLYREGKDEEIAALGWSVEYDGYCWTLRPPCPTPEKEIQHICT